MPESLLPFPKPGESLGRPAPAAPSRALVGLGHLDLVCRDLGDAERIPHTEVVGATPMWEWAGDDTTVFSY